MNRKEKKKRKEKKRSRMEEIKGKKIEKDMGEKSQIINFPTFK